MFRIKLNHHDLKMLIFLQKEFELNCHKNCSYIFSFLPYFFFSRRCALITRLFLSRKKKMYLIIFILADSSTTDRIKSISPLTPSLDGKNNWHGSYRKDHFLTWSLRQRGGNEITSHPKGARYYGGRFSIHPSPTPPFWPQIEILKLLGGRIEGRVERSPESKFRYHTGETIYHFIIPEYCDPLLRIPFRFLRLKRNDP